MIKGAKKGSQQAHKPHIAKDDLVSTETLNAMYGLCEGEIAGLADGGKSIRLDGTPIINDNGQPNFEGVTYEFRSGTNDQSYIKGFPSVENEIRVGVELRHDRQYVRAINNKELSAVRLRLNFNALRQQHDNGNITGYAIEYAVDVQTDGGAFVQVLTTAVRGKASSGFKRSHRIDLPKASRNWTIRVRRITPNRDSDLIADTMMVDAITEIIDAKLRYPNTAMLAVSYNAKTFSNVAKIAVRLKGKLIQVPTNYDPTSRTYTGLWDGTFKLAYSDNPAWVFYDLCTHKRYGLGERLNGMVDKWRLYQIAQYCDEMVDDGMGGREPRFAINVYIQKADDAYRVLQNIASCFRGLSFWDGSQIVLDSDTPKDPVYTFSPVNVVGEFNYQGTRQRDRRTVAKVAWDNPENEYSTEYEMVRDEAAIAKYGIRMLDINAFGCTSKGQAQRAGLWALKSEQLETRTVSFKTGLMGFIPQVGQIINIADNVFAGRAVSGRIVSANARQITLDRTAGKVGDMLTINTDGTVKTAKITAVRGETVTLDKAIGNADDVWAIVADDLKLMQFRVLTIAQNDDATFDITALQYDRQKYDVVDNGAVVQPQPYTVLKATPIAAPKSVTITANTRTHQGQAVTTLTINWEQVQGAVAYIVEWRKDDGNWQTLPKVAGQSVDIDGVYSGAYMARVRAVDSFDSESLATSSVLTRVAGKVGKPAKLASLTVTGGLFSMVLGWTFGANSADTNYTEIQVSPDGRSNIATLGTFAYPTNKHEITGLQGNLTQFYRGRIVDKLGNTSDWTDWVSGTTSADAGKVLELISGQINSSHLDQTLRTPIARIGELQSAVDGVNAQLPTLNSQLATANRELQTAISNITTERNRISSAIRDISVLQSANNAKTAEIANLTQTVGSHTSSIRELGVTTGDLSQKYAQIKTQADNATSEISAIKQTQSGQASSIDRLGARFDSLAVGGRNLLLNTQTLNPLWTIPTSIENGIATFVGTGRLLVTVQRSDNIQALENGKVTISFTAKSNQNGRLHIRLRRFNTSNRLSDIAQYVTIDSREYKRYSLTLDYSKWTNQDRVNFEIATYEQAGFVCEVKLPKLEIGTIATDWTPAPEDLQTAIDEKASTATLDEFKSAQATKDQATATKISQIETAYKSADNNLTAKIASETTARTTADNALSGRIDSLQSEFNGNKSSVANQIKALTDKDSATASQISQLTANVTTAQNTANTANGKADTATTKADNAQRTANNANSAITAEQRARADADSSLASRIDTLNSDYNGNKSSVQQSLATLSQQDRTQSEQLRQMQSSLNGMDGSINTAKATLSTLERTVNDTNRALSTAKTELNARFDGLAVGGRNLILDSNITKTGYNATPHELAVSDDVAGARTLTLSADIVIQGNNNTRYSNSNRAGVSVRVVYTDGTASWLEIWQHAANYQGRMSRTWDIPANKTIASVNVCNIQTKLRATVVKVSKPKLEKGSFATDWTPAIEDVNVDLSGYATTASLDEFKRVQATKDTATTSKISQMQSSLNGKADSTAVQSLDNKVTQQGNTLSSHGTQLTQLNNSLRDKANASALTTLENRVSQVDGKITAETRKISQLQTTLNGQTTSIRNVERSVNGVRAIKAVTVDNNGVISGYGLISELQNGHVTSRFGINADQFYLGNPANNKKPFIINTRPTWVNGVLYPAGAFLDGDFIATGSINGNKITANTSITAPVINGGQININNRFIVDSQGNVTAKSGLFEGSVRADKIDGRIDIENISTNVFVPHYTCYHYHNAHSGGLYISTPTDVDRQFSRILPSWGGFLDHPTLNQAMSGFACVYEMRVFVKTAVTVTQNLTYCDDWVTCDVNDQRQWSARDVVTGNPRMLEMRLEQGINTIVITLNSPQGQAGIVLLGDFIDNNNVKFMYKG